MVGLAAEKAGAMVVAASVAAFLVVGLRAVA